MQDQKFVNSTVAIPHQVNDIGLASTRALKWSPLLTRGSLAGDFSIHILLSVIRRTNQGCPNTTKVFILRCSPGRHSWNALLLWRTLRYSHMPRTNLGGLQEPPSLYHQTGIPGGKLPRLRDRQLNIIMLFFQLFSGRVPLFVSLHLWHARHAP